MTLGLMSTGAAGKAEDLLPWPGIPGRDEFFWITEVNKATLLTNLAKGLLTEDQAAQFGRAVKAVAEECAATFQRAILRDETLKLLTALASVVTGLLKMAEENRDTLIPCYTNGVAAQPSNMAHVLLAHAQAFLRDMERSLACYRRLNESPMGACVLNGTGWPLDRDGMAAYLGFDKPVANTFDAGQVAGTDVCVDAALELVHPMLHVGQFIAELMQQYAQPRPWILVSATYASSAMPQKRNPGPLIDIRRDAAVVLSELNSVVMRTHNLPTGMYDAKDEKLNREIVGDASSVVERFATVLGMLRIDKKRALEELNLDWTATQELADVLMRRYGIPFRVGHGFASRMVTVGRSEGYTPKTFPKARAIYAELYAELKQDVPELPADFPLDEAGLRAVLDPAHIILERAVAGGPQPVELEKLFKAVESELKERESNVMMFKGKISAAQKKLKADFEALIA